MSPDEKCVSFALADKTPEGKSRISLGVASIEDGTQRILLTEEDVSLSPGRWSADGKDLIVLAMLSYPTPSWDIWLLPLGGGAVKKLGLSRDIVGVTADPGAKRIAFTVSMDRTRQIWAIDNLMPSLGDEKQSK